MDTGQLLDLFSVDKEKKKEKNPAQQQSDGGKTSLKAMMENLGELWDEGQYEAEYNLDNFIGSLKWTQRYDPLVGRDEVVSSRAALVVTTLRCRQVDGKCGCWSVMRGLATASWTCWTGNCKTHWEQIQSKRIQEIGECATCCQSRTTAMSDFRNEERFGDDRVQLNYWETKQTNSVMMSLSVKWVSPLTVMH